MRPGLKLTETDLRDLRGDDVIRLGSGLDKGGIQVGYTNISPSRDFLRRRSIPMGRHQRQSNLKQITKQCRRTQTVHQTDTD